MSQTLCVLQHAGQTALYNDDRLPMEKSLLSGAAFCLRSLDSRVTLGEETETAHDVSPRVRAQRRERVLLEHAHDVVPLALGLGVALRVDPFLTLAEGQVGLRLAVLD